MEGNYIRKYTGKFDFPPASSGVLAFDNVDAFKAAYPKGLDIPVWLRSDKDWYYWDASEVITSYAIPLATSRDTSATAGGKGSSILMKQTVTLTELALQGGKPNTFEVWTLDGTVLGTKLVTLTPSGTADENGYYVATLATPLTLNSGQSYMLTLAASVTGTKSAAKALAENGTIFDATAGLNPSGSWPYASGGATTSAYVYDWRFKFGS